MHKFEINGTKIVMDENSGAVHAVDGLVWELLDDYGRAAQDSILEKHGPRFGREEVMCALSELGELEAKGLLNSPDPLPDGYSPPKERPLKALCLHLAHACNLRCRYCFAGQGQYGGADGLMPLEVGQAAIDFLVQKSGRRKKLEVDFFGGEPLLNAEVMKKLVDYGRRAAAEHNKEISFTLTTNALLLDEELNAYLEENGLAVILSLDGRPSVHDAMRVKPDGGGSYSEVLPKIASAVKRRLASYYVRGTFTRGNLDFCNDFLHLVSLGFEHISLEPVVAPPESPYALREEDLPRLFGEYERLAAEMARLWREGRKIDFFHFNVDLEGGPCLLRRLTGCGAGVDYLAVTPSGDIYPCHQFAGKDKFLMGSVFTGIARDDLVETFKNIHVYSKEDCRRCWARFYCGGGCHAAAHSASGSLLTPDRLACAVMKKRLECAIYLQVVAKEISVLK